MVQGDGSAEKLTIMTDSISEALERLQLYEESTKDDPIDDILSKTATHRQRLRDPDELKAHLEKKYLSPSQTFSTEWLNRLQQYVICYILKANPTAHYNYFANEY